jgi:hypothetical protein
MPLPSQLAVWPTLEMFQKLRQLAKFLMGALLQGSPASTAVVSSCSLVARTFAPRRFPCGAGRLPPSLPSANACAAAAAAERRSQPAPPGIRGPTAPGRQTITANDRRCPRPATATARLLQTGTGTAISTAISTAVIFSFVDRLMASSERDANLCAAPYAASRGYAVTEITLRPAASRVLSPRPLAGFGRRRAAPRAARSYRAVLPRSRFRWRHLRAIALADRPEAERRAGETGCAGFGNFCSSWRCVRRWRSF